MASDDARILVIGAGVNGSICAERLFERGVDVTVLARGKRLAEIESNGIVIENAFSQKRRVAKVRAIGELAPGDAYDYILVVVRRNQVGELLPTLAANTSPNVVFMSNNLNGPAEIVAALCPQRPMLGFVFAGGKRDGDIIRAIGPFDHSLMRTPFGEIDGTVTPRLKRLVELLNRAGLRTKVSTHIVDYLATHAAGVAAMTPLAVKYRNDSKALARSPKEINLMASATRDHAGAEGARTQDRAGRSADSRRHARVRAGIPAPSDVQLQVRRSRRGLACPAGARRVAGAGRRSPRGGHPFWRSGPSSQKFVRHQVTLQPSGAQASRTRPQPTSLIPHARLSMPQLQSRVGRS
jgi:ketopantoate reductase